MLFMPGGISCSKAFHALNHSVKHAFLVSDKDRERPIHDYK